MEPQSVLDNFDGLRKPPKFHHACCKLIKHLDRSQQNKAKGEELSQEMKYALKRLIRGMGSADQGTVVGFSACFAALLKSFGDIINISTINEYVESELELKSSLLRGEEGIVTFGRVLVYGCIIRSNIIEQLNSEEKSFILDQLLLFCYKRSYISGPVYYYIENFLKIVKFEKKYVKIVLSHVLSNKFHMNIDMLHLLLTLQNVNHLLPSLMATTQSKGFAIASSLPNVYKTETLPDFINILTDIRSTDDLNRTVYARFANNLLHVYSKQSPRIVKDAWTHVEADVLTSRELSLNRTLAVFKLFCSLILHCETSQQILTFLTPNFLHAVIKVTSDIPSDLTHSISPMFVLHEKFANKLVLKRKTDKLGYETVEHGTARVNDDQEGDGDSDSDVSDDEVEDSLRTDASDVLTMIELFLRDPALINVEKITHTRIVQTLINSLDKVNVHRLATLYKSILNETHQQQLNGEPRTSGTPSKRHQRHSRGGKQNGGGEVKKTSYNNKDKIYILSLLTKLVVHPSLNRDHRVTPTSQQGGKANGDGGGAGDSEDQAWKYEQVEYVFDLALGVSPWNHELAAAYKKALFSLLGHQLHHELLERLVNHANQLLVKGQTKNIKVTPEMSACWSQCQDMIAKLKKKIGAGAAGKSPKPSIDYSKKSILIAFHTMYLQLCLYLFLDNSISIDVIDELNHCYERFDERKQKSTANAEEPHWIEVITELFLSLLSKESQLLRHLVTKVFKLLVPTLTVQTVQQILQVLDPSKNPLKGDGLDESDDEEDDNEDGEEEASEEEEDEEEEESDIDEEYLGNESNTDRLRQAVNQALGQNGNITDAESVDMSDIDPTEAQQLDAALASAFSALKKPAASSGGRPSKHQAKAEARLVSFRVRVLDLIDTIIRQCSYLPSQAAPAMLDILSSLFVLLKYTSTKPSQKPLETRLRAVLKQFGSAGVKKSSASDENGVSDQVLADVLSNSVLDKGDSSMSTVHTMGNEICSAILYLARTHASTLAPNVTFEQLAQSKFAQCLLDTLECFFTKSRACIVPAHLFKSLLAIAWPPNALFLPALPRYAFSPRLRYYHRATALGLLYVALRNRHLMDTVREERTSLKAVETALSEILEKTAEFVQDSAELSKAIASYTRTLCDVILTIKARPDIVKSKRVDSLLRPALSSGASYPALTRLYRAFDIKKPESIKSKEKKKQTKKEKTTNPNQKADEDGDDEEGENSDEDTDANEGKEDSAQDEEEEEENDDEPAQKKRKKKHRQSKSRKKTKLLRMTDLSKGIEDVGGFDRLQEDEEVDEPMDTEEDTTETSGQAKKKSARKSSESNEEETGRRKKKRKTIEEEEKEEEVTEEDKQGQSETEDGESEREGERKKKMKEEKKKRKEEKKKVRRSVEAEREEMGDSSEEEEEEVGDKKTKKRKRKKSIKTNGSS